MKMIYLMLSATGGISGRSIVILESIWLDKTLCITSHRNQNEKKINNVCNFLLY